ncbi:hypothetical protein ACOSQ2_019122 [Xanthoceras sorbifolium]
MICDAWDKGTGTVTAAKVADDQEERMEDIGNVESTFLLHKDLLEYERDTEKCEEETKKHRKELKRHRGSLRPQRRRLRTLRANLPAKWSPPKLVEQLEGNLAKKDEVLA